MKRDVPFLHGLDAVAQQHLRETAIVRVFPPDSTLFRAGDRSDHVLIVTKGHVKIATLRPGVGEVVLAERVAGDLLGELSAIDSRPRSADAVAVDEVTALSLTNAEFKGFLEGHAVAALALLEALAYRLRAADARHIEYGETDSVSRLAGGLLDLVEQRGEPSGPWTMVAMSPREIAAHLQASPDDVANSLELLEGDGVVEAHRRGVTIINPTDLAARARR